MKASDWRAFGAHFPTRKSNPGLTAGPY